MFDSIKRWVPLVSGFVLATTAALRTLGQSEIADALDAAWLQGSTAFGLLAGLALKLYGMYAGK
jgi:hypothetical protein